MSILSVDLASKIDYLQRRLSDEDVLEEAVVNITIPGERT